MPERAHGKGKLISHQGYIQEGYFVNNQMLNGRIIYNDATILVSELKDEKPHGKGCRFTINND